MKRRLLLPFLLCLAIGIVMAEETTFLDRETSIELALENNRSFRSSTIALATAQREAEKPLSVLIPDVSASSSLSYTEPLFSDPLMVQQEGWTFGASVSASLPLQTGLVYTVRETMLAYEAEQISWEAARLQLIASVEREFYYLLAAGSNLEILETSLDLARDRAEQTQIMFENGRASEVAMLQVRVSAANQEPEYLSAQAAYRQRLDSFLIVLGFDPGTEVTLEGELTVEPREFEATELFALIENRSDIRSLRLSTETLRNSRSLVSAGGRTPVVQLTAGWNTNVADAFENESWRDGLWADGASLGISVTMPLDDFLANSSTGQSIAALDDTIAQAEISLEESIASAEAEITGLLDQLETSRANIESSRLTMEYAFTAYEMSEEAYRRGTMERLDVEDSQQSYLTAAQANLQSRYDYLATLINLRLALGVESLERIEQ